jgi:uncharacterized protein YceK
MVLAGSNKKRRAQMVVTTLVVLMMAVTLVGCSGVSSSSPKTPTSGTPAGTYNIVVQGTGTGNVSRTTNLQLIVQ